MVSLNSSRKIKNDSGRKASENFVFSGCLAEKEKRRKFLASLPLEKKIEILEILRENARHIKTTLAKPENK